MLRQSCYREGRLVFSTMKDTEDTGRVTISPVGFIRTPFDEKFAVPRQSSLVHHGHFEIFFYPPYDCEEAFNGIDEFSHLWITFLFDRIPEDPVFRPMVRPPRLGGNTFKGVFATRSPFRPNRTGLSVVRLVEVKRYNGRVSLIIDGADMVNNTPVIDVKPYIKFFDSVPDAVSGFALEAPKMHKVVFSEKAMLQIKDSGVSDFKELIEEVLSQDPRPAYRTQQTDERVYGVGLCGFDVKWQARAEVIHVLYLEEGMPG